VNVKQRATFSPSLSSRVREPLSRVCVRPLCGRMVGAVGKRRMQPLVRTRSMQTHSVGFCQNGAAVGMGEQALQQETAMLIHQAHSSVLIPMTRQQDM
jgi:hypothetical protein